ncbi:6-phosphogluconate dehydrogenase NADP-binding protein [Botryosphaeria dothidea]|uniref:6-phosphogluconate dehydrogenase NADP-binding protein n=1 Tax=Botryosphaeria dothidea TaxID=55169 RepID=A0A8H4MZ52_9PEZI|nr:6-phosphogluconate dehydrogenase NADP-binding protein [Botryosphaeria dothidea]
MAQRQAATAHLPTIVARPDSLSVDSPPFVDALGKNFVAATPVRLWMQTVQQGQQARLVLTQKSAERWLAAADTVWLDDLIPWTPVQYRADAWFPPKHLRLPANKGNEAMVYLTFIIDNYHDFPPYAVFTHGHLDSWHQEGDLIALVRALNLEALEREKYIALRCDWYPSCPAEIRPFAHDAVVWGPGVKRNETEEAIVEAWGEIFPGEEVPQTLAKS